MYYINDCVMQYIETTVKWTFEKDGGVDSRNGRRRRSKKNKKVISL